jgi:hypothetical protein
MRPANTTEITPSKIEAPPSSIQGDRSVETEPSMWKGRKVRIGCCASALVEMVLCIILVIPGVILKNDPLIWTGIGFGILGFASGLIALNCTNKIGDTID